MALRQYSPGNGVLWSSSKLGRWSAAPRLGGGKRRYRRPVNSQILLYDIKGRVCNKGRQGGCGHGNKTSALISAHLPPKLLKNHEPGGRREDEP